MINFINRLINDYDHTSKAKCNPKTMHAYESTRKYLIPKYIPKKNAKATK